MCEIRNYKFIQQVLKELIDVHAKVHALQKELAIKNKLISKLQAHKQIVEIVDDQGESDDESSKSCPNKNGKYSPILDLNDNNRQENAEQPSSEEVLKIQVLNNIEQKKRGRKGKVKCSKCEKLFKTSKAAKLHEKRGHGNISIDFAQGD